MELAVFLISTPMKVDKVDLDEVDVVEEDAAEDEEAVAAEDVEEDAVDDLIITTLTPLRLYMAISHQKLNYTLLKHIEI